MSAITFFGQRRLPQYVEEEVAGYGAEFDPFADEGDAPCRSGSESACLDYGAEDPGLPPGGKFAGEPRRKSGRRSPADVIAGSLFSGAPRSASNSVPVTPADVIAQALYPPMRDSAQELLKQSFWQVWLQHRDYLKKKAFIFWIDIARMPRMS